MISRIYNWGCDANEDNRTNPYLPVIFFGTPLISMTALKSRCLRRSHTSKFSDMATEKRQKNFPKLARTQGSCRQPEEDDLKMSDHTET